jgi:predicted phage replisome organizer
MSDIKWIKISTNIFDDEKIKLIENLPEGDTILIIWIKLLVLAGRCNQCGLIYIARDIPYDEMTLTTILNRPSATVKLAIETFIRFGMIEIMNEKLAIINWEKHQNLDGLELMREQSKMRMRKYREKRKLLCDATVTQPLPKVTQENKSNNKNKNKNKKENSASRFTHESVRAWFTDNNTNYYHDAKQAACINKLISKAAGLGHDPLDIAVRFKHIIESGDKFWCQQPLTPARTLANYDAIVSHKDIKSTNYRTKNAFLESLTPEEQEAMVGDRRFIE